MLAPKASRRSRNPLPPPYRPQLIWLEERLPLGDALLSPLLTASWLGANLTSAPDGEFLAASNDDHLGKPSWAGDRTDAIWVESLQGTATAQDIRATTVASSVGPVSFDAEEPANVGAAPAAGRMAMGGLRESPVSSAEATGLTPERAPQGAYRQPGPLSRNEPVGLGQAVPSAPTSKAHLSPADRPLPLSFEANVGQADPAVQYLARGPGYGLFLTRTDAVMVLGAPSVSADPTAGLGSAVIHMQVVGGRATTAVGQERLPGQVNYFRGHDPSQWHTHVATYAQVAYPQVYPGIDLVYHGGQQPLEYDFVVAPGADPHQIALRFPGADRMELDVQGDLVLHSGAQELRQHQPVAYQEVNGVRQAVASAFVLQGQQVRFAVGAYDPSRPLVIDPVLTYSTYLGGSGSDQGFGIAVDPNTGDILVAGETSSPDFPTVNAWQPTLGGDNNAFVARLTADGSALVYATYLGGSSTDYANAVAVDPNTGDALVTGFTSSPDFPTACPIQSRLAGESNAFVARLSADGSTLKFSTYVGGSVSDRGTGIALDPATGDAVITGKTNSPDFPTARAFQPTLHGGSNAFITRLRADGSAVVYSTYLGGSGLDSAAGVAIDPTTSDVLVTGQTNSPDFPTANALQPTLGGASDDFVTRLSADGSTLVFSTYLGGSKNDFGGGIAVDPSTGDILVTGETFSTDFPTVNAVQPNFGGGNDDAFIARLNADGQTLVFSTFLGGSITDFADGIVVDPATGDVLVAGLTDSPDFPTVNALQPTYGGGSSNGFVTRLSADGRTMIFSTYLGGSGQDRAYAIALDPNTGDALVTGWTSSTDFPTVNPLQATNAGSNDAFVARIAF